MAKTNDETLDVFSNSERKILRSKSRLVKNGRQVHIGVVE